MKGENKYSLADVGVVLFHSLGIAANLARMSLRIVHLQRPIVADLRCNVDKLNSGGENVHNYKYSGMPSSTRN